MSAWLLTCVSEVQGRAERCEQQVPDRRLDFSYSRKNPTPRRALIGQLQQGCGDRDLCAVA
jgi:hypothetical protein